MINESIDIEAAMKLLKKQTTDVDGLCGFIYKDITAYQDARENFYFEEFKNEFHCDDIFSIKDITDENAEVIVNKIEKDVKLFTVNYVNKSLDCVLDAINEKRIKSKKHSELLLVVLSSLKEINEEIQ